MSAKQAGLFMALQDWFSTEHGSLVADAFRSELASLPSIIQGDIVAQLGNGGSDACLQTLRYKRKWIVTPYANAQSALISDLSKLPFARDSIDCFLSPLCLDGFADINPVIDEIDRVLKSMGYAIFFGVNPLSLWGMWLNHSNRNCFGSKKAKPHSALLLQRALQHRGYHVCYLNNFYYIPPVKSHRAIANLSVLNVIGKMVSPLPAGFYCLVVQKLEENGLIPLTQTHDVRSPTYVNDRFLNPACHQKH